MSSPVPELARLLRTSLAGRVEEAYSLARHTTYRLGGPAALYVEADGADDLALLGQVLKSFEGRAEVPLLALGRGSNTVISDEGWPGIVVRLGPGFSWIDALASGPGLRAGGGTSLPQVANWAARRRLAGLEFLVAVPGSVGGAVRMNAGAHGGEIADTLAQVIVYDLGELRTRHRESSQLDLSYRHSNLAAHHVVIEARFAMRIDDEAAIRGRMKDYRSHRAATQPPAVQNAGSTFKNPPGDSAGRLVEAAGLKGFRVGGAWVSTMHANFFMTEAGARAQDVYDLVHEVKRRVAQRFGVELTPEVRFAGRFESAIRPRQGSSPR